MLATSPSGQNMLSQTALRERSEQFELQEAQKINITPAFISELQELLLDVDSVLRPRPSDYKHREHLVKMFTKMAKEIYGSGAGSASPLVKAFGSYVMNIFTAKSDLDLSINFSNDEANSLPRDKKISALKKFARVLYAHQRKGLVSGVVSILKARVPILKVVDCRTGIECDISVENKDGIVKSLIIEVISSIDERFQKLCFLMKAWAKAHDINSSKDHTLNSISITMLVAFHLQTRDPPILPPLCALLKDGTDAGSFQNVVCGFKHFGSRNKETLAELFVALLVKLASVETLWQHGLCASTFEGSWISKFRDILSVEDFLDRSQNCARVVREAEVQKIYKCIHGSLAHLSHFMRGQIESTKLRTLLFGPVDLDKLKGQVIHNEVENHKKEKGENHKKKEKVKNHKKEKKVENHKKEKVENHNKEKKVENHMKEKVENHKRRFPVHDLASIALGSITAKRMRYTEVMGGPNYGDITSNTHFVPNPPVPLYHPFVPMQLNYEARHPQPSYYTHFVPNPPVPLHHPFVPMQLNYEARHPQPSYVPSQLGNGQLNYEGRYPQPSYVPSQMGNGQLNYETQHPQPSYVPSQLGIGSFYHPQPPHFPPYLGYGSHHHTQRAWLPPKLPYGTEPYPQPQFVPPYQPPFQHS